MISPRSVPVNDTFTPQSLCSIDPISMSAMAIGGLASGAASSFLSSRSASGATPAQASPVAPPTQMAQPVQQPTGQKPTAKSSTPTFLGQIMQPVQSGQKSLLGQ